LQDEYSSGIQCFDLISKSVGFLTRNELYWDEVCFAGNAIITTVYGEQDFSLVITQKQESAVMVNPVPITREGHAQLIREFENLTKIELPLIIRRVAEARSHGDLKENAEYHAAREHQAHVQNRMDYLSDKIARSQIIAIDASKSEVIIFGSRVKTLMIDENEEEEFALVGEPEADPRIGKISTSSPIGKGLLGKRVDDIVEVETPGGRTRIKILALL
jgi:transcription elongation factor GreA